MSEKEYKPIDKKMVFLFEDTFRWESFEYYVDEDDTLWIRWCNSGSNYQAGEHTVEWFEEGFVDTKLRDVDDEDIDYDNFDRSDYYQGVADDHVLESIKDKFDELREDLDDGDINMGEDELLEELKECLSKEDNLGEIKELTGFDDEKLLHKKLKSGE